LILAKVQDSNGEKNNELHPEPRTRIALGSRRHGQTEPTRNGAYSAMTSASPKTWHAWLRSILRWLATTPPLLLVLLVGMDFLSSTTGLPLGLLLFVFWASAAVLWAAVEVFAGGDLRFRLTRLILIVAIVAVMLGYWQVTVYQPFLAEQRCLASLKGLKGNVYRETAGPSWLVGLLGKTYFQRVFQLELAGPEADEDQVRHLQALPHLRCLFLTGSEFDDEMLDDLAVLPGLQQVWLTDSRVTKAGVEQFLRARPSVQIARQGAVVDDPSRMRILLNDGNREAPRHSGEPP